MCTVRIVSLLVLLLINVTTSFVNHVAGRYKAGVLLAEAGRLLVRLRESQQEKAGDNLHNFFYRNGQCSCSVLSLSECEPGSGIVKIGQEILLLVFLSLDDCVPIVR
jgi:hypothetical protein